MPKLQTSFFFPGTAGQLEIPLIALLLPGVWTPAVYDHHHRPVNITHLT